MRRDHKQPAKSDEFCSTDEIIMSQTNIGDLNELLQQGNNPAQPPEAPQPAQPPEAPQPDQPPVVPFVPPEGLDFLSLPSEMDDFLPEQLENQVLDIPQPPAQLQDQVPVFPQSAPQMPMTWNNNPLRAGISWNNNRYNSTEIASNPLSSGITSNNSHYNHLSAGFRRNNSQYDPLRPGFYRNNSHYNPAGIRWSNNHYSLFNSAPQMPMTWNNNPLRAGISWNNNRYNSTEIASNPLSSGITLNNSHYNHLSSGFRRNNSQYDPLSPGFYRNNSHYNSAGIRWSNNHYSLFNSAPQMPMTWNNNRYNSTEIASNPLSSGITSNNSHYNHLSAGFRRNNSQYYPLSPGFYRNNSHYNPAGIRWSNNHYSLFNTSGLDQQRPVAEVPLHLPPEAQLLELLQALQPNQVDGNASSGNNDRNNDRRPIPYTKEEKKERVKHYLMNKKPNLNFNKKIKYDVRKRLADIRPRKMGKFVGNSEAEPSHRYGLGASDPDDTGSGSGSVMHSTTQCALPTQQDASLQSQDIARQNNELRLQVHFPVEQNNPRLTAAFRRLVEMNPTYYGRQHHQLLHPPVPQVPVQFQQHAVIPPQDASLQSQELAWQNNELRSQVHRQGHEELISPTSWPNAPSGSGDDHEADILEQELRAAGLWESDAGGGDEHTSGSGDEVATLEQELRAAGLWESDARGGDEHTSGSGDEAATLEQELRAAGLWESDARGGDEHTSGSGDESATLEQELRAAGLWKSDAGGGDDHVRGKDPS